LRNTKPKMSVFGYCKRWPDKALHRTAIPLRAIPSGELGRDQPSELITGLWRYYNKALRQ